MKIDTYKRAPGKTRRYSVALLGRLWRYLVITVLVINGALLALIIGHPESRSTITGVASEIYDYYQVKKITQQYPLFIKHALKGVINPNESLSIDIKHVDMQELEFMRQQAIAGNRDFKYVPATISNDNQQMRIRIRLKGDRTIHFESLDNASFRIETRGDNTLFGMKKFSLHKPRARNYVYEWIFLRWMEKEGIIAPRYKFIDVMLNGKNLGLYAMEEHYSKHLIEHYGFRDGPIIRFSEATFVRETAGQMAIAPFDEYWLQPENLPITNKAIQLLEAFRQGELPPSKVFDLDKMATFFAIGDVTGANHSAMQKSIRLYYNPITSRLEPIAFDGHFGIVGKPILSSEIGGQPSKPSDWIATAKDDWFPWFFNDITRSEPAFYAAYIQALKRFSDPDYIDAFFGGIDADLEQQLALIYQTFPLEDHIHFFGPGPFVFSKQPYYEAASHISQAFTQPRLLANLAHLDSNSIQIEVDALDKQLPILIESVDCAGTSIKPNETNRLLLFNTRQSGLNPNRYSFPIEPANAAMLADPACLSLNYKYPGDARLFSTRIYPWPRFDRSRISDVSRQSSNIERFDFLLLDDLEKTIQILPGEHILMTALIVPAGYRLLAGPGTRLQLDHAAMIYSHSPVEFIGTEQQPVVITTGDTSGQGIFVNNAKQTSKFEHVEISNLVYPSENDWSLTGSLNFYQSPVEFSRVLIKGSRSEDALNIIRSRFTLDQVSISDSVADAIDIDFGRGSIVNSTFMNIGNDAIDVSGSIINLSNITVDKAGDKALSTGEDSQVTGSKLDIRNAKVGIASKDNSTVTIDGLQVRQTEYAFAVYQKKPEYGPGFLNIKNLVHDQQGQFALVAGGSTFLLDGESIRANEADVELRLYGPDGASISE